MKLIFAACARNCAAQLMTNIPALLKLSESSSIDEVYVYIVENDSSDHTRKAIEAFARSDKRVIPILLANIQSLFATREDRIAYCRDMLLDKIIGSHSCGLYIAIDLDLNLAGCIESKEFLFSCETVSSGKAHGIFPSSKPFYYDIHALRCPGWCEHNTWERITKIGLRGSLASLIGAIMLVYSKQTHYLFLQRSRYIEVNSAFGGIGIYSLQQVLRAKARYTRRSNLNPNELLCEHVLFNSSLNKLFIDPSWLLPAPLEHIQFKMLPLPLKVMTLINAAFSDGKKIIHMLSAWSSRCLGRP